MELPPLTTGYEEFEWNEVFDFNIDDQLLLNLDASDTDINQRRNDQSIEEIPDAKLNHGGSSDRVRKRDPRMVCENFLAGKVPCACPELKDAKMMMMMMAMPTKFCLPASILSLANDANIANFQSSVF